MRTIITINTTVVHIYNHAIIGPTSGHGLHLHTLAPRHMRMAENTNAARIKVVRVSRLSALFYAKLHFLHFCYAQRDELIYTPGILDCS